MTSRRTPCVLLETDRLVLRAFTPSDGPLLVDLDSDPEVMRYLTGGMPTPPQTIESKVLPRFLTYDEQCPAYGYWAAIDKRSLEFAGWFGFHPREGGPRDEIEVGYRLRRAYWGRGLATEGVRALIRNAFEEHDARRVVATTYEHNLASRRVMEKAGMHLHRRFRMTTAELAASPTSDGHGAQPWDGDDVEYVLDAQAWARELRGTL